MAQGGKMRIAVAQTRPVTGNVQANVHSHTQLIDLAVEDGAELVVFPELSITGYQRTLANDLAVDEGDRRFDVFQDISDTHHVSIGIGARRPGIVQTSVSA